MLRPRHPDKFPGLHIGWGGRIYGAIPFLHALSPARINTGVWGTEPFPSVYRMDAYPFAFLPHSARWQLLALIPIVVGTVTSLVLNWTLGMPILLGGLVALGVTGVRCVKYALATDIEPLLLTSKSGSIWKGLAYHASLTWLHFLQPLARGWGRLKGELSTYQSEIASEDTQRAGFQLGPVGLSRIPRISSFRTTEQTFWSETWISAEAVLVSLAAKLRPKSAIQILEIDDGWQSDYDIRVGGGRLARLDVRVLVEEHGSGRCLIRVAERPRVVGVLVIAGVLATTLGASAATGVVPFLWALGAGTSAAIWLAWLASKFALARAVVTSMIAGVVAEAAAKPLEPVPPEEPTAPVVSDEALPGRRLPVGAGQQGSASAPIAHAAIWQLPRPRPVYVRTSRADSAHRSAKSGDS